MKLSIAAVVTLALLLGGCSRTPTPGPTPTASPNITATPVATRTPTPALMATPGATPTATPAATPGAGTDTTPPVISDLRLLDISETFIEIGWTTSEPATCQVEYGRTMEYGLAVPWSTNLTINHAALLDGLETDTPYHFRIRSRDAAGNESVSEDNVRATYHHI